MVDKVYNKRSGNFIICVTDDIYELWQAWELVRFGIFHLHRTRWEVISSSWSRDSSSLGGKGQTNVLQPGRLKFECFSGLPPVSKPWLVSTPMASDHFVAEITLSMDEMLILTKPCPRGWSKVRPKAVWCLTRGLLRSRGHKWFVKQGQTQRAKRGTWIRFMSDKYILISVFTGANVGDDASPISRWKFISGGCWAGRSVLRQRPSTFWSRPIEQITVLKRTAVSQRSGVHSTYKRGTIS